MTPPSDRPNLWKEPGVTAYVAIGLVALGAIMLVMLQRTYWALSLVPILAGLGAGFTGLGPFLLIAVIAVCLGRASHTAGTVILDLVLSSAVLAYVAAHYRLQSIFFQIFPSDPRRREDLPPRNAWQSLFRRKARVIQHRRSPRTVTATEIQRLPLSLPLWAVGALILWRAVQNEEDNPGLRLPVWQTVQLAWLLGLAWFVGTSLIGYWQWRQMSGEQATLYLQDQLWAETRREQRRLNRWLAWGRRRVSRQEEEP
jgi:hypothetical protein